MTNISDTLNVYRARVETTLSQRLAINTAACEQLNAAMAYSTLNAGKRLRPILVYAAGTCFGQSEKLLDYAAAAIECIHCYSLIHDDLPAMDDDSLRRGKPTCHIAFDEATAILAGDALQSLAFEFLSSYQNTNLSVSAQLKLFQLLATASGANGMVAGQSLDLKAEGKILSADEMENIHHLKTGALIQTSLLMGAAAAECFDQTHLSQLATFGRLLGLAFQLQDDLLDSIGQAEQLGKNPGQDSKHHKATYTTLFGEATTRSRIKTLTETAINSLDTLPQDTTLLKTLCLELMHRKR